MADGWEECSLIVELVRKQGIENNVEYTVALLNTNLNVPANCEQNVDL